MHFFNVSHNQFYDVAEINQFWRTVHNSLTCSVVRDWDSGHCIYLVLRVNVSRVC